MCRLAHTTGFKKGFHGALQVFVLLLGPVSYEAVIGLYVVSSNVYIGDFLRPPLKAVLCGG